MRARVAALPLAALITASALVGTAQAGTATYSYRNARYGFSVSVPSSLHRDRPPVDGDGLDFLPADARTSHAGFFVFGQNNVSGFSPRDYLTVEVRAFRDLKPSYTSVSGNVIAFSGIRNGQVIYERSVVGAGSIDILLWEYPAAKKRVYDPLVTLTVRSYRPGDVAHAH